MSYSVCEVPTTIRVSQSGIKPLASAAALYDGEVPPTANPPIPMLDFSRQYALLRDEVLAAITRVCDSQRFILGPEVASFETAAAAFCDGAWAIGCSSGTDALWLALAACEIRDPAQTVVTSPFSFFASASAIVAAGARPAFADIDPLTFNLSATAVAEVLDKNEAVAAIVPVHLFGQCADWDAFSALRLARPGLRLLEDAAQAFGARWNGVAAGALGDAASFSFYPTKNLAAFGDAGMVTTQSEALAERVRMLRAHGMRRRYFHDEIGWNCRLDTLQAAVLEVKLKYVAAWNRRRQELAANYNRLFLAAGLGVVPTRGNPGSVADGIVLPFVDPRGEHVFHQYVIRVARRDEVRARLTAQGIGTEVYYPLCLHEQQAFAHLGYRRGEFPVAERAAAEVLALPMYPELREEEQERVVKGLLLTLHATAAVTSS